MLQLQPVLLPQTTISNSTKNQSFLSHVDLRKLQVAKEKLQDANCPNLLKMVSYLRISSSIIEKIQARQGIYHSGLSSYSRLMKSLAACHPQWWTTCFVTSHGELTSHDSRIEQILKSIESLTQNLNFAPIN